jgi:hypothetical protein
MRYLPTIATVFVVGVISCDGPAFAGYNNGGPMVNGSFSDRAYGGPGSVQHRPYIYDDGEIVAPIVAPKRRLAERHPKQQEVKVATLEKLPEVKMPPAISNKKLEELTTPPVKPSISEQNTPDENEQRALAEKAIEAVGINKAYAMRQKEGDKEWTCLTKETKMMLARIEGKFGKVTFDGTCVQKTIRGTGVPSQHSFGKAIDFHPPKNHSMKEVVTWLIEHHKEGWVSGIMTYRNYDHCHIDTGPYHFESLNAWG